MSSTLDIKDWAYSKAATMEKSGSLHNFAEDYVQLVADEGGETGVSGAVVINMDECARRVRPRPPFIDARIPFVGACLPDVNPLSLFKNVRLPSMDFALAVESRASLTGQKMFMLVDCKLNTDKPRNVKDNVSNTEIRNKFYGSISYIDRYCTLSHCDVAFFLFEDKNFEQVRRAWGRRTLNNPQNKAIKISEFDALFAP